MTGTLYIIATPIGNLEDITYRAVKTLKEVDLILAEDTRVTAKLLSHYQISAPAISYHQQSPDSKKQEILLKLLEGKNIALVTDAGTPGISDPGNELIAFVHTQMPESKIVPIPGPSSITAALSVSGLNLNTFLFIGFWPKKKTKKLLEKIKDIDCPVIFFDSPYRVTKTLTLLIKELGEEKHIVVAQELTKLHERILRGTLTEVKIELAKEVKNLGRIKGELVCILEP